MNVIGTIEIKVIKSSEYFRDGIQDELKELEKTDKPIHLGSFPNVVFLIPLPAIEKWKDHNRQTVVNQEQIENEGGKDE